MVVCQTEQGLSIDALRYLQLVTANHVLILLRRGSSCHQMTEIAAHFTQIRSTGATLVRSSRRWVLRYSFGVVP